MSSICSSMPQLIDAADDALEKSPGGGDRQTLERPLERQGTGGNEGMKEINRRATRYLNSSMSISMTSGPGWELE
jgi:hypothetical protein